MIHFLHVADLHLDRNFQAPKNAIEDLKETNKAVLENIVNAAIERQVDFVLFVGDTFHQSRTSLKTQAHFFAQLKRLEEAEIQVVLSFGNHDYYEENRYWFDWGENVKVFKSDKVEQLTLETATGEKVAISGFSYTKPEIIDSKVSEFPRRDPSAHFTIGMYHGEQAKAGHYAPFSVDEMKEKNYDYWALGHIHVPEVLSTNRPMIAYAGTPQGHTKKETQVKGILYVILEESKAHHEYLPVEEIRYETLRVDLSECETLGQARQKISEKLLDRATVYTILLEHTSQLDEEFLRSYHSGELLAYFSETFWIESLKAKQHIHYSRFRLSITKEWAEGFLNKFSFGDVSKNMDQQMPLELVHLFDEDFFSEVKSNALEELTQEYEWAGEENED